MNLIEILKIYGLNTDVNTKMVRHQSSTYNLQRLLANDQIEEYQAIQKNNVFSNCEQIVSFIGDSQRRAKFFGVYTVVSELETNNHQWSEYYLYPEMPHGKYFYKLEKIEAFNDLSGRLVIDWGAATLSWHQWLKEKDVIEILPKGFVRHFPGYLDFVLDYQEMCKILATPEANREWHQKLEAVAGIYLILDSKTGKQYIGSAYGAEGILGRWNSYVKNGHGGNTQLIKLLESEKDYSKHFRFTILRTLSKSMTKREVIEVENLYMKKLGTREFHLN